MLTRGMMSIAIALALAGCVTMSGPTPFEVGGEAPPPAGCVEGRERGVDC